MSFPINQPSAIQCAAFFLFAFLLSRGFSTNQTTYAIFSFFSLIGAILTPLFLILTMFFVRFKIQKILMFFGFVIILIYNFIFGHELTEKYNLFFLLSVVSLISGAILAAQPNSQKILISYAFLIFLVLILAINLLVGNMFRSQSGQYIDNYQGISRLSGALLVSTIYFLLTANLRFVKSTALIVASLFFGFLCILGGGRGELLFAMVAIIPLFASRSRSLILIPFFGILILSNLENIFELRGIVRFMYLIENGTTGMRAELASETISVLMSSDRIFLLGCRLNCFQYMMGYEFGLYPHNYILEAILTFGIFLSIPVIFLSLRLLFLWLLDTRNSLYLLILQGTYFLLVALKSGGLTTSFLATFFLLACSTIHLESNLFNRSRQKLQQIQGSNS